MPKISILVPVYNVEKYIRSSIESVLNQSFKDYELILVNDGTLDKSGEICDEYAGKDERIKVIHKKNEGFYSARNIALSQAKGEYVYFMDSDDWLEENLLKENLQIAQSKHADVVFFGHFRDRVGDRGTSSNEIAPSKTITLESTLDPEFFYELQRIIGMAVWQMIIRRDVIEKNELSFPKMKREPDMSFLIDLYNSISGPVVFNHRSYYHHIIIRSQSKLDHESFINHRVIFEKAFNTFTQPEYDQITRKYLTFLFVPLVVSSMAIEACLGWFADCLSVDHDGSNGQVNSFCSWKQLLVIQNHLEREGGRRQVIQ